MAEGQPNNPDFNTWMIIALLAMVALALIVIIIFRLAMRRILRERERMRAAELTHQRQLLEQSIAIQERERQRIAADLHDELAARLNVLKMGFHEMKPLMPTDTAHFNEKLLKETIDISRNLAHDLYPPLLANLGLSATLEDYLYPIRKQMQVKLSLLAATNPQTLQPQEQLQLLRIVQELVQNTLKHAQAKRLEVTLRYGERLVALKVADNGKGFNQSRSIPGLGMASLESRIQVLKGHYKIKSKTGIGTTTIIVIPQK